jgi:hypothetical protein
MVAVSEVASRGNGRIRGRDSEEAATLRRGFSEVWSFNQMDCLRLSMSQSSPSYAEYGPAPRASLGSGYG